MEQNNEQKTSKYSSGINIIIRLNTLWIDTHAHSRIGLFAKWNEDLDCIWRELARDLSDDNYKLKKEGDKEKGVKGFDDFDKELEKVMPFQDAKPEGFRDPTDEQTKNRSEQYKILSEKQLFLARLENFLGKGTTEDDEDDDGFD